MENVPESIRTGAGSVDIQKLKALKVTNYSHEELAWAEKLSLVDADGKLVADIEMSSDESGSDFYMRNPDGKDAQIDPEERDDLYCVVGEMVYDHTKENDAERKLFDALRNVVDGRCTDADGDCVFCGGHVGKDDNGSHTIVCPIEEAKCVLLDF